MWFFPYGTDAPIHHFPIATIGLIVANLFVFFGILINDPTLMIIPSPWVLTYGNGLHPDQWIASGFMHSGFWHLLSNMIFLWVFGLIVEGKIGAAKFLGCYFAILISEAAIEQAFMFWATGSSLGASSAIFGIMAIAGLWAPSNNVTAKWGFGIFFIETFEIPVAIMVAFYVGLEILLGMIGIGSSLLHLGGALIGAGIGLVMLKTKLVDCEGWDIFSMNKKNAPGAVKREKEERQQQIEKVDKRRADRQQAHLAEAAKQIRTYLEADNCEAAYKLHDAMHHTGEGVPMPAEDLHLMVRQLHKAKRHVDSVPFMQNLIRLQPEKADSMRIALSQICVAKLDRPGYALELLAEVNLEQLKDQQKPLIKRIAIKAEQMRAEGVVELDDPPAV